MKKKKLNNTEAILARAEKLYARGNFSLALREFEKAQKKLKRDDLAVKIGHCRQQAKALESKDLIKRGRKSEKKGDLKAATTCFEAAFRICHETWLKERIEKLNGRLNCDNALLTAQRAEAACDFENAADWYARACKGDDAVALRLKRVQCLVKAEKYAEAIEAYKSLPLTDPGSRYDYGLSLAKSGRYRDCLDVWKDLDSNAESFVSQKRTICRLLSSDLYQRRVDGKDSGIIFHDADFLLRIAGKIFNEEQIRSLENLRRYCKYDLIEKLWEEEKYEEIADLLESTASPMPPELLVLHAKLGFRRAEIDCRYLEMLLPLWLTSVHHPEISTGFESTEPFRKRVRQKLIAALKKLIQSHAATPFGRKAAIHLAVELEAIEAIRSLVDNREKQSHSVSTPMYAAEMNTSKEIIDLIRANRSGFKDERHYLETGAYYSAAGKSLYLLKEEDFESALLFIENLPPETIIDEFIDYATQLTYFNYGIACIDNGERRFKRYLNRASDLLRSVPDLCKAFIEKTLEIDEWEDLLIYEEALEYLNLQQSSTDIRRTLSMVMIRRAVAMANNGGLGDKAVRITAEKAVKLYPENEMARRVLNDARMNQEIGMVCDALSRHKLGKASRLAERSQFPEVRKRYFEFVGTIYDQIMESGLDHNEKRVMLNEIYEWSTTVDMEQPIIGKMQMQLDLQYAEEAQ